MARTIHTLIAEYTELNTIYQKLIDKKSLYIDELRFITDFWNNYKDTTKIEKAILELIESTNSKQLTKILSSLEEEIDRSISICDSNELPDLQYMISFVRHYIYTDKQQIDELGKQIKEPRERYTKANANYDFIGYRQHTDEELEQAKREYEESKAEYTYFSQKLEYLYKLQEERRKEVAKYTDIHVSGIHAIGTATKVLIAKYQRQNKHYEQQQRTHPKEAADISQEYFSMTLIGQIYDKCVDIQFEQISAPDFHANVNLYPCKNRLKIKAREKIRVCYLIFLMSEKLSKQYKDEWRNKILELLEIDESYYKSKYKEPVSDFPSDSNQKFAKEMESIFR